MARCAECGFLSLRNRFTWTLDEADKGFRGSGEVPELRGPELHQGMETLRYPYAAKPVCFQMVCDLSSEVESGTAGDRTKIGHVVTEVVLGKDRDCQKFTKWQQGFTPKEHREMLDRDRMMEREERRDREAREWQRMESHSNRRWRFWEFVVAVLGVLAIVGITLAAAFIERGGQPTINVIVPSSTSDTAAPKP